MPDELKNACGPVLILQPIIENAIKYGVSPSKGKIAIRLTASAAYGLLVLRIENDIDPKAPAPASGTGLGLGNVRERLLNRYRSEEHTSELQSIMRIAYAVFCLKKNKHMTVNDTVQEHQSDIKYRHRDCHTH